MLRSSRTVASLIRSLLFVPAVTIGGAAVATTVVGCKDESQPEYWIDKLEDPKWRPRAINRLAQFFEDTANKSGNDMSAPEVKALLDQIIGPLTDTYVNHYDDLDTKTRVALIKLLSDLRDPRTEPALKKAFEMFVKNKYKSKDDADIKWAVRAAGDLKLDGLADPMLQGFTTLKAHTMLGGITYKDYTAAMVKFHKPSWSGTLIQLLEAPIVKPKTAKDRDKIDDYRDQSFWQITAAQILGLLKEPTAVEPLLKVLLDPEKVDAHVTALLALVKIGKPSVERAVKLLNGQDEALAKYHAERVMKSTDAKEPPKGDPHVEIAAAVIGMAGREDGLSALLKALDKEGVDKKHKAIIARELTKIPPTEASKAAFKRVFEELTLDDSMGPGVNSLTVLADSAGNFYDPSMATWLLDQAANAKGSKEDKMVYQLTAALSALKLAGPNDIAKVKKPFAEYVAALPEDQRKPYEGVYDNVAKLVEGCKQDAGCYLDAIEKSENQSDKNQMVGIKAGYMIAILGDEKARDELLDRLDAIENAAVRFTAAQAIDHLSPKGSTEVADKLEQIIEKNEKTADSDKIAGDQPLKQVMYRLDARASG